MNTNYLELNEVGVIDGVEVQCLSIDPEWRKHVGGSDGGICKFCNCVFYSRAVCLIPCRPWEREDRKNVYFKKNRTDMNTEVQISSDQNRVIINGQLLDFYPVKRVKKNHCCHCWLMRGIAGFDCTGIIPCRSFERSDKKNGVFSVRQTPKK
jgi:hypothetical protein